MIDERYKNYLRDLGALTKVCAREAISDCAASDGSEDANYKTGYMMGLHRVVTLMQQQAESFGISLEDIGLADIDENEFLSR